MYVTMVPRMGNETLRPLGVATRNALSVTRVRRYICKNTTCCPGDSPWHHYRRDHNIRAAGRIHHPLLRLKLASEAWPRGRSVSFPIRGTMVTYVTWDVPLHGNFELRPLGVATGNVIPPSPCWGECKPISRKRRALSQLYPAKGVAPGTVDGCQWYYPLRPKARAAYPSTYLLGAGITGPRVELKVLESEKDSFKGIWPSTWRFFFTVVFFLFLFFLLGPGRSLRGYQLLCTSLLRELSQQTSW